MGEVEADRLVGKNTVGAIPAICEEGPVGLGARAPRMRTWDSQLQQPPEAPGGDSPVTGLVTGRGRRWLRFLFL